MSNNKKNYRLNIVEFEICIDDYLKNFDLF